ncbi:MAG TPA: D-aminoacyl-tRNA deacylase [bacterium]|nr:D-aminoacyl-tRNA deacylase [bacterium]HPN45086.1 D-aminoacyl-tRNA deacylase [bacterium]
MRALIQRVTHASVTIEGKITGEIGKGLVVLLGVTNTDSAAQAAMLAEKIVNLRIFSDAAGKFNLSALDVGAELLAISQFTLYADCRRGRRPGFTDAAPPDISEPLYEKFVQLLQETGLKVATGIFGANMLVSIYNDGPVTIMLDSDEKR